MKILVIGASGQVGRSFLESTQLEQLGELWFATRDGAPLAGRTPEVIDLGLPASLSSALDRLQPEIIINAAAYTMVDEAEREEDLATQVNGKAVGTIGTWAAAHNALVVHYSTDYVFDGRGLSPYRTDAPTAPLNAYGRSKLAGELALRDSGAAHLIFRTSWVYAPHGRNFLRTMLRVGAKNDELRVVADQQGAPTDANLIARASIAAIESWQRADADQRSRLNGVHHLTAGGSTSWYAFASAIFDDAVRYGLLAQGPRIIPISSNDYPTPARRPLYSVLDNSGFQRHFGFPLPSWRDGLRDVMARLSTSGH